MTPVAAWAERLEDRTLLSAPTVVEPIADVDVHQDEVVRVAAGLENPLFATAPPGDAGRLFILEKNTGRVRILDLETGAIRPTPFLDLPEGNLSTDSERGLLGLAFHPDYETNGQFYVNFTDAGGTTNVTRYRVSAGDPDVADPNSALTVLTIGQPFANHNGGWMDFGPDGFLYIASGDGGGGNDPGNNAQDLGSLLGKMLRIDVNADAFPFETQRNYAIPADNPFVGVGGRDEIWAYGLRNPWRPSFDRLTGDLYIADVGQGAREEVNFQLAASDGGENYGWRLREGTIATPGVGGERPPGAVDPVYDYTRGSGPFQGRSVTGGYVYRGPIADLQGQYIFGDFLSGGLWSFRVDRNSRALVPGSLTDLGSRFQPDIGSIDLISSFGEDAAGNVYIVDFDGEIFRIATDTTDTHRIDLSRVFRDSDGDPLTFSVVGNSDPTAVQTGVNGNILSLSFARATDAPVAITVRATAGGESVETTFRVAFHIPDLIVTGADAGGGPHVRVFDAATGVERWGFNAYDPNFTGGVRVATGDVSGDGVPDILTAAGPGGGPHVRVFDGSTGEQLREPDGGFDAYSFHAYDAAFTGGVFVAAADLNGDRRAEIITGADAGGGPHVRVFDGATGDPLPGPRWSFHAYDPAFRGGVRVATGDVNRDGVPDILTAAGPGGGPHVRVFDGATGNPLLGPRFSFHAYDPAFTGGVYVAAADLSGDGRAEILTGAGPGGGPHVRAFNTVTGELHGGFDFHAYDPSFRGGVRVGAGLVNGDDVPDLITAAGPGAGPHVRVFDGGTGEQLREPDGSFDAYSFHAYDARFSGGVFAAGSLPTGSPPTAFSALAADVWMVDTPPMPDEGSSPAASSFGTALPLPADPPADLSADLPADRPREPEHDGPDEDLGAPPKPTFGPGPVPPRDKWDAAFADGGLLESLLAPS